MNNLFIKIFVVVSAVALIMSQFWSCSTAQSITPKASVGAIAQHHPELSSGIIIPLKTALQAQIQELASSANTAQQAQELAQQQQQQFQQHLKGLDIHDAQVQLNHRYELVVQFTSIQELQRFQKQLKAGKFTAFWDAYAYSSTFKQLNQLQDVLQKINQDHQHGSVLLFKLLTPMMPDEGQKIAEVGFSDAKDIDSHNSLWTYRKSLPVYAPTIYWSWIKAQFCTEKQKTATLGYVFNRQGRAPPFSSAIKGFIALLMH